MTIEIIQNISPGKFINGAESLKYPHGTIFRHRDRNANVFLSLGSGITEFNSAGVYLGTVQAKIFEQRVLYVAHEGTTIKFTNVLD